MKTISIIFIVLYLMLPVASLANPCLFHGAPAHQEAAAGSDLDQSDECPSDLVMNDCEGDSCCTGHLPLTAFTNIPHAALAARLLPHEQGVVLPNLIDRIFVPPQNRA